MKFRKSLAVIIFLLSAFTLQAQNIKGKVYEINNEQKIPLSGANVFWQNTTIGTATDGQGEFSLFFPNNIDEKFHLIVSYIGYKADTLTFEFGNKNIEVVLSSIREMNEVVVKSSTGRYVLNAEARHKEIVTEQELTKAACCNLSESFETNASVDVSFNDALTGAKRIQLLGLDGIYSQMMTENIPGFRGLSAPFGLSYVPGTWMQSIQISKGAASVVNGYESITGQINIEYKKPDGPEQLQLNIYENSMLKGDINANGAHKFNEELSTMLLTHGEYLKKNHDINGDGFSDVPDVSQYNIYNRWKYRGKDGWVSQLGFSALGEDRNAGQLFGVPGNQIPYKININTEKYEVWNKTGYIFQELSGTSIGFINRYSRHLQNSHYGNNIYDASQTSYYSNLLLYSDLGTEDHNINTGFSFQYDSFDENLNGTQFDRTEKVPGVFIEHTYHPSESFAFVTGVRADFHNIYGTFFTPRFHARFKLDENTTFRASIGKGYRSPNAIAENSFLLATSKEFVFEEDAELEEALNYGFNVTKHIDISGLVFTLNADFYRTEFQNQYIVDRESEQGKILFYNLDGESYANNYQLEIMFSPVTGLDIVTAYRYTDVKAELKSGLKRSPFVNRYKALVTASYLTKLRKWQFDFTFQLNGDGRLPADGLSSDTDYPAYGLINAQITKKFHYWDIYVGGENLTGFQQSNPIISSDDPYSNNFNAARIWGPLDGAKFYIGARYSL